MLLHTRAHPWPSAAPSSRQPSAGRQRTTVRHLRTPQYPNPSPTSTVPKPIPCHSQAGSAGRLATRRLFSRRAGDERARDTDGQGRPLPRADPPHLCLPRGEPQLCPFLGHLLAISRPSLGPLSTSLGHLSAISRPSLGHLAAERRRPSAISPPCPHPQAIQCDPETLELMRSYMDLLRRRGPSLSLAAGFWPPELTRGYPRLGAVRPVSSRRRRVGCARGWRRTPPTAAFSEPSRNLLGSFPSGGGASLLPRRLARPGRRRLRPRQGSQHTHPPGPRPRTQTVEIGTGRQTDESQKAALGPRRRGSHKHTHIRANT